MERILATAMQKAAGIKVKQISFDKPSGRYAALLGGHVDILFEQPGDVKKFLQAKKMKPVLTFLKNVRTCLPMCRPCRMWVWAP